MFILAELGSSNVSGPYVALHIIYIYFLGTVPSGFSLPYLKFTDTMSQKLLTILCFFLKEVPYLSLGYVPWELLHVRIVVTYHQLQQYF